MPPVVGFFAAIGSFIGANVGMFALAGVSFALNAVGSLLRKKPSMADLSADLANRTVSVRQAIAPRRVLYGHLQTGGIITDIYITGDSNEYLHLVVTVAGHPIHSFLKVLFDGEEVADALTGTATGKYAGVAWFEFKLGATGEAAFPGYIADVPDHWTSAHRQDGCASVHIKMKWDQDKYPNGLPDVRFEVEGKEIWDPRSNTIGYSNNPALCVADYMMDAALGLGVPSADMDEATLIAAANICDETVTVLVGSSQVRYTCDGGFDTDVAPADAIRSLLTAMAGDVAYSGGVWFVHAGAYRAPSLSFTDDDLRGPIQVQVRAARRDLFNAVKGVFISPNHDWQPTDFPPVMNATYQTEDGGELLWMDIELPFTSDHRRAQRLAKIQLETSRRQLTMQAPCKLGAWQLTPGDGLYWTRSRFNWTNKELRVRTAKLVASQGNSDESGGPTLGVDLALQEWDSHVFDWTPAADEKPEIIPNWELPSPDMCAAPTGVSLTADATTAIIRSDGVVLSVLKAAWTPPNDMFVRNGGKIHVSFRKATDTDYVYEGAIAGDSAQCFLSDVVDGEDYYVQLVAENTYGARSSAVVAGPCTIEGVGFSHASYRPLTNPLSAMDAGGFPRVVIDGFTMRIAGVGDVSLAAGQVDATSSDFGKTAFLYYDDPSFAGGTIAYNLTFTRESTLSGSARFFVGSITLPDAGGASTSGNNDGGSGAQTARNFVLLPAAVTADAGWTNPTYAADDIPASSAKGSAVSAPQVILLKGFPAYYMLFSSMALKIRSQVTAITGSAPVLVEYTRDGGASWRVARSRAAVDTDPVDTTIALSAKQQTDQVQVRMTLPGGSGAISATIASTTWANDSSVGTLAWTAGVATDSAAGTYTTYYLRASSFGLAVPSGASIRGFSVRVNKEGTYTPGIDGGPDLNWVADAAVRLVKGGVVQTADRSIVGNWPSLAEDTFYGASTDLWGASWTDTDVNATNFGVAISARLRRLGGVSTVATVHTIEVTVYYAMGSSTSSGELFSVSQEVTI